MRPRTLALALAWLVACASSAPGDGAPAARAVASPPAAILPAPGQDLAPAQIRVLRPTPDAGRALAAVEDCSGCHAEIAAQWRSSAHAHASFDNPIYRVAVERLRKDRDRRASRFCAGCHDVALLVDGAMDAEIDPKDARAHAGVACRVCHGVTATRPDGNASFTLDVGDFPVPKAGSAESVKRHKERAGAPLLRTAALCMSCHRSFLDATTGNAHHLVGQDDATPWSRSAYAGSRAERVDTSFTERDCAACHMPYEDAADPAAKAGKVRSHRFLGGHTFLAQMRYDREGVRRQEDMLRNAATIDVAAVVTDARALPADGADLTPGQKAIVEVVVRNVGAGHRFPGGVLDAQDTWIELMIDDARGRRIAEAGTLEEATGADATAHRLASAVAGEDGRPLLERQTHLFRAGVYNHTILPRDAAVARYAFTVPEALPLRAVARLRHRSRTLALQRAACDDVRTARGGAFSRAQVKIGGRPLDACLLEPVTEVARAEALLGPSASKADSGRVFDRVYAHGLAMLHERQERLDEARPSFERALDLAKDDRQRAMALAALADLAAGQGRTEDALALASRASGFAPGHPAIARIRGEALAAAWRWSDAAAFFQEATSGAPKDDAAWARLAVTLGGAGKDRDALDAAQRGLLLSPRDADMLRVQALALRTLGAPAEAAALADEAFLARRPPDDAPRIRASCSRDVPGCALERVPVHVHEMR